MKDFLSTDFQFYRTHKNNFSFFYQYPFIIAGNIIVICGRNTQIEIKYLYNIYSLLSATLFEKSS